MAILKKNNKKWDYKNWFFLILAVSWVTGLTFFFFNNFILVEGEFGPEKHPLQYPILKIHGASSFAIMVAFGYFLSSHVKKNWKKKGPKPILGVALVVMPILSMITAYCLYYISSDDSRQVVSYIHSFIGLCLPFVLLRHISHVKNNKARPA